MSGEENARVFVRKCVVIFTTIDFKMFLCYNNREGGWFFMIFGFLLTIRILEAMALGMVLFMLYLEIARRILAKQLIGEIIPCYFHGFPLCQVLMNESFGQLSGYIGYGLCYETSVLMMLALKKYRSARIVYADAIADTLEGEQELDQHAFVEFRKFGLLWCIDISWATPIALRWWPLYRREFRIKRINRVFSYDEFWQYPLSLPLYEKIHDAEHSHILFELSAYASHKNDHGAKGWLELPDNFSLGAEDGLVYFPGGVYRYGRERPMSNSIIRDFLARPERQYPTARSVRKARKLDKVFDEELAHLKAEREGLRA